MKKRKQPFGYEINRGVAVINATESCVVKDIFNMYAGGASFKEILNMLEGQPIHYDADRPWNKNMIGRILGDIRYTGQKGYPQIILQDTFNTVDRLRNEKYVPDARSDAQKLLMKMCSEQVTPYTEKAVLMIMNAIIEAPCLLHSVTHTASKGKAAILQDQLVQVLAVQPIDEERAKQLIYDIASEEYSQLGNSEYETRRLRELFERAIPMMKLDAGIIKASISKVVIDGDKVSVLLKNGQTISLEDFT